MLNGFTEPSIYKLSSRAPRFFCPDTGMFSYYPIVRIRTVLCCQHPSYLFTDVDRCIYDLCPSYFHTHSDRYAFFQMKLDISSASESTSFRNGYSLYTWPGVFLTFSCLFILSNLIIKHLIVQKNEQQPKCFAKEVSSVLRSG